MQCLYLLEFNAYAVGDVTESLVTDIQMVIDAPAILKTMTEGSIRLMTQEVKHVHILDLLDSMPLS